MNLGRRIKRPQERHTWTAAARYDIVYLIRHLGRPSPLAGRQLPSGVAPYPLGNSPLPQR